MTPCPVCLDDGPTGGHAECFTVLFGVPQAPTIDVTLGKLHTAGLAMAGRASLSGVQRKLSVGLSADRLTLRVAAEGRQFILKPQSNVFPHLPENEHVTLRIAQAAGLTVPPCALLPLADGSLAYLVARFDRTVDGRKRRMEDFCQLAGRPPRAKYRGSAELLARLVQTYASEPALALADLYRQVVFSWWIGNGDAHLKNFALLAADDGRHHLSPAYDLLCTRLVIPDDRLALPVGGRDAGLTAATWRRYADYMGLPPRAAARVRAEVAAALPRALALLARSALPAAMQADYAALVEARAAELG